MNYCVYMCMERCNTGIPLIFIYKVLLKYRCAHLFTCCLWLILHYNNRVVATDTVLLSMTEIFTLIIHQKSFLAQATVIRV